MDVRNRTGIAFMACALLATSAARAEQFDFEDLAIGSTVTTQYAPRGLVLFSNYIDTHPHAHSGTHVLRSISPSAEVFTPQPLVLTFTSPQAHVAFFAGNYTGGTGQGTLRLFAANGTVLGQDGPKPVPADVFTAHFEVTLTSANAVRAEFQIDDSALELIDDLTVEGTTGTLPTSPPVVAITAPADNAMVAEGPVPITGTVTGDGLLSPITLRIKLGLPDDSTAPPSDNAVSLSGTGTTRTFTLPYNVITGAYTVTAIATNTANMQGTATVHFSSLPDAIRARYDASGGAATFGALKFGTSAPGCVAAIYDNGLIGLVGGQTFIVQGAVFQKWLATRDAANPMMSRLGCPIAEERDAMAGSRAQDFQHGRIYATASSTAYVPEVFRDALDTLDEKLVGIAVTDPTESSGAMETWLFQRFARLDFPTIEPSTLEIRGSPPQLFVERVGDGGRELASMDITMFPTTPTVYRTFPCDGNLGPCTVTKPATGPTISDGERFCDGKYPETSLTEWHRMLHTEYEASEIGGFVHASQMSCIDNPLTHDNIMTNEGARCNAVVGGVTPSDWQVYVLPIAPYGSISTFDQTYLEIEFEEYYALYFFVGWGWPIAGDLIYANGRWIMDCGHEPFKTEIHPPFLMAHTRGRTRDGGGIEDVTEIWITGYYPGDPIEVNLWPPPRPTPDSYLTVIKPVDAESALDIEVGITTSYAGAKAKFSSSTHREVDVDHSGKMNWQSGRGYEGEWEVYWSQLTP